MNILFSGVGTAVEGADNSALAVDGENVTADGSGILVDDGMGMSGGFTNCIFTGCDGSETACTENHTTDVGSGAGVYVSGGDNFFYLPVGSGNRTAGTSTINYELPPVLHSTTTYAPQNGSSLNTGVPDRGFHYPPSTSAYSYDDMPDSWEMEYFGTAGYAGGDLDSLGNTLLYDYANGINPNPISFVINVTNLYVNITNIPLALGLQTGLPAARAVLVDSTNFSSASWGAYTTSNLTASIGATNGWHTVWVGLRGGTNGPQTWNSVCVFRVTNAPVLVLTHPTPGTVMQPMIELQGYANEELSSLTFDVTNASGAISNQIGFMTGSVFNTNSFAYVTNYFQCYDLSLTNGTNRVTLHATDLGGNVTTTNFVFNLSYAARTNPPVMQVYWPTNGTRISGSSFTIRGYLDDFTTIISVQITDTNGDTNIVAGVVERNGNFWVDNVPLSGGTNALTLTATDAAGNVTSNSFNVVQSSIALIVNPVALTTGQSTASVAGTMNTANYKIWVNGVAATQTGTAPSISWYADNVPMNGPGSAVVQTRAIPTTNNSGNGTGGGGGGTNSSMGNPGNPLAADAVDSEINQGWPAVVICSSLQQTRSASSESIYVPGIAWEIDQRAEAVSWTVENGGIYSATDCDTEYGYGGSPPAVNAFTDYSVAETDYDTNGFGTSFLGQTNACGAGVTMTGIWSTMGPDLPNANQGRVEAFYSTSSSNYSYLQNAQSTEFLCYTEGRDVPTQPNAFAIGDGAQQIADPWFPIGKWQPFLANPGWTLPDTDEGLTTIDRNNVTMLGGGMIVGATYRNLPANATIDSTPHVIGAAYWTSAPSAVPATGYIYFNGTNVTGSNVTVVVGQQINLSCTNYIPNVPGEPIYLWTPLGQVVPTPNCQWTVPGYAISNYDIVNGKLYTNFTQTNTSATFYWVASGTNQVSFSSEGVALGNVTFTVLRPTVTFTDGPMSWATNDTIDGTFSLGLGGNAGAGTMTFYISILSPCPGRADYTQLVNRADTNGFHDSTTTNQYWLDSMSFYTEAFYFHHTNDPNFVFHLDANTNESIEPFNDGPCFALRWSLATATTTTWDQFKDYIMFRPDNGNATNNIYVPLGKTTWSWSASSTHSAFSGWSSPAAGATIVRPTSPDGGYEFPLWTNVWNNN